MWRTALRKINIYGCIRNWIFFLYFYEESLEQHARELACQRGFIILQVAAACKIEGSPWCCGERFSHSTVRARQKNRRSQQLLQRKWSKRDVCVIYDTSSGRSKKLIYFYSRGDVCGEKKVAVNKTKLGFLFFSSFKKKNLQKKCIYAFFLFNWKQLL